MYSIEITRTDNLITVHSFSTYNAMATAYWEYVSDRTVKRIEVV